MNPNALKESDLHAYVDGALPEAERDDVARFLIDHPEQAEQVRGFQMQKRAIKALYDPILDEAIPERLRAVASAPSANSRRPVPTDAGPHTGSDRSTGFLPRWSLQRIAAGIAVAVLGGAAGWTARDQLTAPDKLAVSVPLPRQAAIAHAVYSPDVRRPVEVSGEQEDQLVAWLSKRIGTPVKPPKLGALGYELVGGRLLPGNAGPVAQFMYQDASGQRLTLFVSTENVTNRETAFRFAEEGPVKVFYWIDGKFGYALSGTIEKAELARLATAVYEQIERR